jgi:hypothetical protein
MTMAAAIVRRRWGRRWAVSTGSRQRRTVVDDAVKRDSYTSSLKQ